MIKKAKMTEYVHLDRNDHPAILLSKVRNMLEEKEFVDLTLASDEGQSIQVHRVIVCAASPYFKVKKLKRYCLVFHVLNSSSISFIGAAEPASIRYTHYHHPQ